jgi:hypothetical protein
MMGMKIVPETLVSSYNQLTWLIAQDFIDNEYCPFSSFIDG